MSLAEWTQEKDVISKISFDVVQNQTVDISDYLEGGSQAASIIWQNDLVLPFNELGKFLINYAMKNAIKSEYILISSRLILIDCIIDFIEAYDEVTEESIYLIEEKFGDSFKQSLIELGDILETMSIDELLYLANMFNRLSRSDLELFTQYHSDVLYELGDNVRYTKALICVLQQLYQIVDVKQLSEFGLFNLIELYTDCQRAFVDLINLADPEEIEEEQQFLANAKPYVKNLLALYRSIKTSDVIRGEYQRCIKSTAMTRSSYGYLAIQTEYLGTENSVSYQNSPVDDIDYESEEEDVVASSYEDEPESTNLGNDGQANLDKEKRLASFSGGSNKDSFLSIHPDSAKIASKIGVFSEPPTNEAPTVLLKEEVGVQQQDPCERNTFTKT